MYFPTLKVSKGVYEIHSTEDSIILHSFEELVEWYFSVLREELNTLSYLDVTNLYNFIDRQASSCCTSSNYCMWKRSFLETIIDDLKEKECSTTEVSKIKAHFFSEYRLTRD